MDYTRYLRISVITGLFLTVLIPFIVATGEWFPGMFFPFITGKNFTFRILVEIVLCLYILLALRDPQYRPRFSWVIVIVGMFTLWAGVATIFSVDPIKSFWSNFERMEGYITILHLFAYFLVAGAMFTTEKLWTWFLRANVGAGTLMAFYGLGQLLGIFAISTQSGPRLDGTLGNATYMAVYMLFTIFFTLFLLSREWRNINLRWFYISAGALQAFILFYTETRGTMLGLIGGLLIMGTYIALTARMPELRRLRMVAISSLGVLILLIGGFMLVRDSAFIKKMPGLGRLASISLEDRTTQSRFMVWNMAWQGFEERPITGWGQENFNFVFNKYYNPAMYNQEQWFDRAHNAFIDWLSNAGAPGFLLFISLFAVAAWAILRARDFSIPERAVLLGLLAGFAVHELFVFDNIVSSMDFMIVLALAHWLSRNRLPATVAFSRPISDNGIAMAAPVVAVALIGSIWFFNVPGMANAKEMIQAISPKSLETLPESLQHFKNVFNRGPLGRQEEAEQMVQFTVQVGQTQGVSPQVVQSFYDFTHQAMTEITKERVGDARLELFFGQFLNVFGQFAEAQQHLTLAHQQSPKKQGILFELAKNRIAAGNPKEGLELFKQAFELDKSYAGARINYAQALYQNGQNAQADALLKEGFGTLAYDDDSLLQVYFATRQFTRAEAILTARIEQNPKNTQARLMLAQVLYTAGDKERAIKALQEAAVADPSFAAQSLQLQAQIREGK